MKSHVRILANTALPEFSLSIVQVYFDTDQTCILFSDYMFYSH